ncbi:MAG: hypothetical protein C0475_00885 [Planctomyces sp.]|nr:hypothetical protein [Planctomyces sp.]MBA4039828.1 hypothetical protein [Planctomyces sp.]MBA4119452.1 hypothetical protein [Isosphaera sp.]
MSSLSSHGAAGAPKPAGIAKYAIWLPQLVAAGIIGLTLPFKLGGAPETVWLFNEISTQSGLGVDEALLRYFTAANEILAIILILIPRTSIFGALHVMALMSGALVTHLALIGIQVPGPNKDGVVVTGQELDGGTLFVMGLVTFAAAVAVLITRRSQVKRFASAPVCYIKGTA